MSKDPFRDQTTRITGTRIDNSKSGQTAVFLLLLGLGLTPLSLQVVGRNPQLGPRLDKQSNLLIVIFSVPLIQRTVSSVATKKYRLRRHLGTYMTSLGSKSATIIMIPQQKMPLAYDQSLISASSTSGFEIGVLPEDEHHGTPVDLPADPKHAVWALAAAATHQKKLPQKSSFANAHSHSPHGAPTMSTFSASSLGHIHIVQPYRPNAPPTQSSNPSDSSGGNPALSNGCSTSTFSVHPTSASTPFSFSNPYCTNQLHSVIPGMGSTPGSSGPGQPPRPANAWILYRSDKMKDIAPSVPGKAKPPQADISKLIAAMWKSEQPEVRQRYEALSDMKKAEHLALYPGYRFQPMKKADREKVRAERKAEKEKERLASAAKSHRKPKPKRATTEDSVAFEENEAEARQELQQHQQQHQGHAANPDPTSPLSPAARTRTFAYKPYTVPSPGPMSPSAMSAGAAPQRRKRTRTKVEASNPALPSEDAVQVRHFYMMISLSDIYRLCSRNMSPSRSTACTLQTPFSSITTMGELTTTMPTTRLVDCFTVTICRPRNSPVAPTPIQTRILPLLTLPFTPAHCRIRRHHTRSPPHSSRSEDSTTSSSLPTLTRPTCSTTLERRLRSLYLKTSTLTSWTVLVSV